MVLVYQDARSIMSWYACLQMHAETRYKTFSGILRSIMVHPAMVLVWCTGTHDRVLDCPGMMPSPSAPLIDHKSVTHTETMHTWCTIERASCYGDIDRAYVLDYARSMHPGTIWYVSWCTMHGIDSLVPMVTLFARL